VFDNTKEWYGDRESGGVGAPARASDAYAQVSEEGSVPGGVFEAMFQVEESNGGQIHLDGLV